MSIPDDLAEIQSRLSALKKQLKETAAQRDRSPRWNRFRGKTTFQGQWLVEAILAETIWRFRARLTICTASGARNCRRRQLARMSLAFNT